MDRGFSTKAELLGRMAKVSLMKGDLDQCISYNTQALAEKPDYSPVILNRANAWFRKDKLDEALADYRKFIDVDPGNPLKPDVVRMIQAILDLQDQKIAAKKAEEARLAAEAAKKAEEERQKQLAEEKRKADEAKRLAEEAAKKKQLDDLFSSLNDASTEGQGLATGTEDVQNKQIELKLEE
jgi:tetratricopeptide (TPR) repeat protein